MLKKGLSFIASEDYSLGFTALKRIVMIRFSLQGRHVFTALKKWTFSCRHLASLLLGSLWKKKNASFSSMYVHVTVTCLISSWSKSHDHGYHLHHFPASPNWLAYTAAAMASSPEGASRLMPWHMQHATTFHITIGKIHQKNIQLRSFKKPSAPVHPWCFCRCPQQRQKIGGCLEVKFVVVQRSFLHQVACSEKQIVSKIS